MLVTTKVQVKVDTKAISKRMPRMAGSPLAKGAAYVKKTAQRSLRRAKSSAKNEKRRRLSIAKPSKEGRPPRHRAPGESGLRAIRFNVAPLDSAANIHTIQSGGAKDDNTPDLLEKGGIARRRILVPSKTQGRSKRTGRFKKKKMVFITTNVFYHHRAYMLPALEKAAQRGKIPEPWRASIKG